MTYEDAKKYCHVRSAIYRESKRIRFWKNHSVKLDDRVPDEDKLAIDWLEYDPREEADKTVHLVENQWHYPILTKYGFEPITKKATGFVRAYLYKKGDCEVRCVTGANADYWESLNPKSLGYWGNLESFLESIANGH